MIFGGNVFSKETEKNLDFNVAAPLFAGNVYFCVDKRGW